MALQPHECKVGLSVSFGRPNGATAFGVIVKLNPKKAIVKLTQQYNSHAPGIEFTVPYRRLDLVEGGKIVESKPEPLEYTPFSGVDNHILAAIACCYCDLSPENLTCDGELSRAQVRGRYAEINRRLEGLFAAYGRTVTEDEIDQWSESKREAERKRAERSA